MQVAVAAAREAGAEIATAFTQPKSVSHKGKVDLVTETDQKCEALILARLMGAFPDFKFIGAPRCYEGGLGVRFGVWVLGFDTHCGECD